MAGTIRTGYPNPQAATGALSKHSASNIPSVFTLINEGSRFHVQGVDANSNPVELDPNIAVMTIVTADSTIVSVGKQNGMRFDYTPLKQGTANITVTLVVSGTTYTITIPITVLGQAASRFVATLGNVTIA